MNPAIFLFYMRYYMGSIMRKGERDGEFTKSH